MRHRADKSAIAHSSPLIAAIERLYEVFARYPTRPDIPGCEHCVFPEDNERVHAKPLRELTPQDLEQFGDKALTTWGDRNDLRHFLPRLLECMVASGRFDFVVPEILLGMLDYGHWQAWPEPEQNAIRAFLRAWWQELLGMPLASNPPPEVGLCAIAKAEDDLGPYLQVWEQEQRPSAVAHLAALLIESGNQLWAKKHKLPDAFWEDRRPQMQQVIDWLASPTVHQRLEQAFFASSAADEGPD